MSVKTKSIKLNFVMNAMLSVSSIIFPFVTFPYVSRVLGVAANGTVATAISFVAYFNMFAQLGIPSYGIRACARVRDNREELTRTAHELLFINLCMSILAYAALAAAIAFIPKLRQEKLLYIVISSSIFLSAIGMEWLYKGLEQYTYITVRSIIFKLIGLIAMFAMVHTEEDYVLYGLVTVISSSASYVFNLLHAHRYIGMKPIGGYNFRRHMKAIGVFFAMACATTVYTNLDVVMLAFMKSDTDVGYYHAAVRIKSLLVGIVTSLGTVLLPRASYYIDKGLMEEFRKISQKALNFIFVVATAVSVYFILFAKQGIFLLSGNAYAGAILPMQVIMPTLLLIGITNILGLQILVPLGREKVVLYSEIVGAIVDVSINALLIPYFAAVGAAVGTLIAEAAVLVVQYIALRTSIKPILKSIEYVKIIIALVLGLACSMLVYLVRIQSPIETLNYFIVLVISSVLFFGVYGTGLILMKEPFCLEMLKQFRHLLFKRNR